MESSNKRKGGWTCLAAAAPNWFASLDDLLMRTLHESIISFVHLFDLNDVLLLFNYFINTHDNNHNASCMHHIPVYIYTELYE